MTTPTPPAETTGQPNPNPPHQTVEPPRPVIVQPQQPDSGLVERVNEMARTLAGLPEQLVNSVRESRLHEQQAITPPQTAATGNAPVTPVTPQTTVEEQSKHGPKISGFAKWWKGM